MAMYTARKLGYLFAISVVGGAAGQEDGNKNANILNKLNAIPWAIKSQIFLQNFSTMPMQNILKNLEQFKGE